MESLFLPQQILMSLYVNATSKQTFLTHKGLEAVQLSRKHNDAVNRRRRIVVQYDAFSQLGVDFKQWLDYRFSYVDEPGSQIDSLWWDIGAGSWAVYPSKALERFEHPGLQKWWNREIDWVQELVDESHQRNLEVFWNHRVSEVAHPWQDLYLNFQFMYQSQMMMASELISLIMEEEEGLCPLIIFALRVSMIPFISAVLASTCMLTRWERLLQT